MHLVAKEEAVIVTVGSYVMIKDRALFHYKKIKKIKLITREGIHSSCLDTNANVYYGILLAYHQYYYIIDTGHRLGGVYFGTLVDLDCTCPIEN